MNKEVIALTAEDLAIMAKLKAPASSLCEHIDASRMEIDEFDKTWRRDWSPLRREQFYQWCAEHQNDPEG